MANKIHKIHKKDERNPHSLLQFLCVSTRTISYGERTRREL